MRFEAGAMREEKVDRNVAGSGARQIVERSGERLRARHDLSPLQPGKRERDERLRDARKVVNRIDGRVRRVGIERELSCDADAGRRPIVDTHRRRAHRRWARPEGRNDEVCSTIERNHPFCRSALASESVPLSLTHAVNAAYPLRSRREERMAEFVWEARGRGGDVRTGTMDAENEVAVQNKLRAQGITPTKVKRKGGFSFGFGKSVDAKDLVKFIRQFATMIDAGLPLVQCLDILASQEPNKYFQSVLRDIKATVEEGSTFSDALKKHPKVFDDLFVNLVHAGEVGGILDTILNRLAVYIEKRVKLLRQLKGALTYPTVVMGIMGIVMGVLMGYVIPAFEKMFAEFGAKDALPTITKIVIAFSRSFLTMLPFIILIGAAATTGAVMFYRNRSGRRFVHGVMLKLPVMGPVLKKIAVARFSRTLGTLMGSGVPILDALDIVAKTSGNLVIEDGIMFARARISEGKNMAEPLKEVNVFPGMVVQMVAVGEQTGALDTMLNKVADFYEDEVDVAVGAMTSLLEPILMVIIGAMVGTVLVAMYLPVFDLAGHIKAD